MEQDENVCVCVSVRARREGKAVYMISNLCVFIERQAKKPTKGYIYK
jgi:hypothetical protein